MGRRTDNQVSVITMRGLGAGGQCNESWVFMVGRQLTQAREGESGVLPRVKTRDKSPRRETLDEKELHLGTPDGKDVITSN